VGAKIEGEAKRCDFYLVDLPGYGYARTAKSNRKMWSRFIESYLLQSEDLQFVCQLIDIRHKPMPSDIKMFQWLVAKGLFVLVIATKADKLSRNEQKKSLSNMQKTLGIEEINILPYSSVKNEGRLELLDAIAAVLVE